MTYSSTMPKSAGGDEHGRRRRPGATHPWRVSIGCLPRRRDGHRRPGRRRRPSPALMPWSWASGDRTRRWRQHRVGQRLDVVGDDVGAARRPRPGPAPPAAGPAWRGATCRGRRWGGGGWRRPGRRGSPSAPGPRARPGPTSISVSTWPAVATGWMSASVPSGRRGCRASRARPGGSGSRPRAA